MDFCATQNILATHNLNELEHNIQQAWKLNIAKLWVMRWIFVRGQFEIFIATFF